MSIIKNNKKGMFRFLSMLLLLAFINLVTGCHYYRVRTFDSLTDEMSRSELQKYQNLNKYLILHSGNSTYHITVDKLDIDKQILYCLGDSIPLKHQLYKTDTENSQRYKAKHGESVIKDEVHIYVSEIKQQSNQIEIPLKSVTRIDVIENDTGRTIASHVFTVLGIVAAVSATLLIIIALTKSSCPFVYVQDGTSYAFVGEIYGGAIFKPLQRNDFVYLKTLDKNESLFKIRISNELKEIQYTDLANIIVAEHDSSFLTMIDNKGKIHSIQNPVLPQLAILNNIKNVKDELMKVDSSSCLFEAEGKPENINELVLNFDKPENAHQAKLIIRAQNSLFLDFSFTQFTKLFGSFYNKYVEKQNGGNRDSLLNWSVNQGIPLSVYIKKNYKWVLVENINTVGPLAARNICVPIDISDIYSNSIELKLQCGYMFWEVDYAAIDFSDDLPVNTYTLKPDKAIEDYQHDVTQLLSNTDDRYLVQPKPGNAVEITYKLPQFQQGKSYDAYLVANGYYNHVRDYEGIPDKNYLMTFKQKGAFVDFAKSLQDKMMQNYMVENIK